MLLDRTQVNCSPSLFGGSRVQYISAPQKADAFGLIAVMIVPYCNPLTKGITH